MPSITLSTGVVTYTESGQGAPLILLHANPGDSRDFESVIPELSQNYRVFALDWPGYGESALPPEPEVAGVPFFYNVLREFLTTLSLPPAYFIGNSIGGNVIVRLASDSPEAVRGLVLVCPGGFTPQNLVTRFFCWWQGSRFSLSPRRFAGLYLRHRTAVTQSMLRRASTVQAQAERLALNRAIWRSFDKHENDARRYAQNINVPTLLLFGKHDPVISFLRDGRIAAACLPAAQFLVLPCGHAPFAEIPECFLAVVQPFLANCGSA